jgi:hypothetical protein
MIVKLGRTVEEAVADVRRPSRDLAGRRIGEERREDELPLRKRIQRPEVDRQGGAGGGRRR